MIEKRVNIIDINISLQKQLNYHGYSFQHAVLRFSENLFKVQKSKWIFKWAEFPVQVNSSDTRIDFVLENTTNGIFIVAECKRVNPAYSNWCFIKTPYIRRNNFDSSVVIESLRMESDTIYVDPIVLLNTPEIYQLGIEVKTGEKGDDSFSARNAIENSATQVLRGVNGLIIAFNNQANKVLSAGRNCAYFLPVIFTTAKLWSSEVDIGGANLETGCINYDLINATEKKWLWLQYNVSSGIKHHLPESKEVENGFKDVLLSSYIRTIAIVNYSGIEDFLRRDFSS